MLFRALSAQYSINPAWNHMLLQSLPLLYSISPKTTLLFVRNRNAGWYFATKQNFFHIFLVLFAKSLYLCPQIWCAVAQKSVRTALGVSSPSRIKRTLRRLSFIVKPGKFNLNNEDAAKRTFMLNYDIILCEILFVYVQPMLYTLLCRCWMLYTYMCVIHIYNMHSVGYLNCLSVIQGNSRA